MDFLTWFRSLFGQPIPAVKPPILANITQPSDPFVNRPIPQCGIDLIKSFEGCKLNAYQDGADIWTIGYGHTKDVKEGVTCSLSEADAWLRQDCAWAWAAILRLVKVPLTANQGGSLLSVVFNLGETQFSKSSLLVMLNSGNYVGIPDKIKQFVYISRKDGGGTMSQGLVNRRNAEAALFIGSDWRQA